MDFEQAEKKFKQLKAQFETGNLSETEFKAQLEELMVQDEGGSWWMIGSESERWYRHDGDNWLQTDPPGSHSPESTVHEKAEQHQLDAEKRTRENDEKAARVKAEREAAERVAREKLEHENAEKAAYAKAEREATGKAAREKAEREANFRTVLEERGFKHDEKTAREKAANSTKHHVENSVTNERFLFSNWGRSLLGGITGLAFVLIFSSFAGGIDTEWVIFIVFIYSVAGFIIYPHKISIIFVILGFLVVGFFLGDPDLSNPENFVAVGGVFGVFAGALLSSFLYLIKE